MPLRGFEQLNLFGAPEVQVHHLIYFFYRKDAKSAEVFADIIFKIRLEGDFKFSLLLLSFAKEKTLRRCAVASFKSNHRAKGRIHRGLNKSLSFSDDFQLSDFRSYSPWDRFVPRGDDFRFVTSKYPAAYCYCLLYFASSILCGRLKLCADEIYETASSFLLAVTLPFFRLKILAFRFPQSIHPFPHKLQEGFLVIIAHRDVMCADGDHVFWNGFYVI